MPALVRTRDTIGPHTTTTTDGALGLAPGASLTMYAAGEALNLTDEVYYTLQYNPRFWNGMLVLLLMCVNLAGNGLVLCVYVCSIKKNVFSFYVVVLATLDLLTGLTTMPLDVLMKTTVFSEEDRLMANLCKFSHFQVYANHMLCGCVLILIARQRYRKVYYPHEPGMSVKKATRILLAAGVVCAALSSASIIINSTQTIHLRLGHRLVNVTICRYDQHYVHSLQQLFLSTVLAVVFMLVLVSLTAYYVYISRLLQSMQVPFQQRLNYQDTNSISTTTTITTGYQSVFISPFSPAPLESVVTSFQALAVAVRVSATSLSQGGYKVFVTVTAVFVLCYLPHILVLTVLNVLRPEGLGDSARLRFYMDLAYNAPYLSTVSNPIIYCYTRKEFRQQCVELLTLKKFRDRWAYAHNVRQTPTQKFF